jgi:ATP-dependent Clp protease protease subunit
MIHQPMGSAEGQASDIEIQAEEVKWLKQRLYTILAHHTGKSVEQIEEDADRNYWLSAEEAQDYGLVDNILNGDILDRLSAIRKNGTPDSEDDE